MLNVSEGQQTRHHVRCTQRSAFVETRNTAHYDFLAGFDKWVYTIFNQLITQHGTTHILRSVNNVAVYALEDVTVEWE